MTDIILFLWLADVVSTLKMTLLVALFMLGMGAFICIMVGAGERKQNVLNSGKKLVWAMIPVAMVMCVVPDKQTMQLLAGAKAADVVISSPIAQKTLNAVDVALDRFINEAKKEKK